MRLPFALATIALAGCSHVTNNLEHDVRGGLWYTRETSFLGMTFDSSVWHCPPPRPGQIETCRQVHEGYLESREPEPMRPPPVPSADAGASPANAAPCKVDSYCPTGFCTGMNCTPP